MKNHFSKQEPKIDVAVIGGGPAGMMAAGRAAESGAKVILIEKNNFLGRKLLLTGKGRCNLAQAEFDKRKFIGEFGKNGQFLYPALLAFGVEDVINFFEERGLKTKTERGGRVFPASDRSMDVLNVLIKYLTNAKVKIISNAEVIDLQCENNNIKGIEPFDICARSEEQKRACSSIARLIIKSLVLKNQKITANSYIICAGGKSYPQTGSTGDGYKWAQKLGHAIIPPRPALVPIKIREKWVKDCQGLSLKNVQINVVQGGKNQDSRFGEMLFTHFGVSGPIILDISKKVGELLASGKVILSLDLKPALNLAQLDQRLQKDFRKYQNKNFKNSLNDLLPRKIIPAIIMLSKINPDKPVNKISRQERCVLVNLLKNINLTVEGLTGFDQAIITTGGVDLREIDPRTMKSKLIDNLFFAGEIINLDGPSGGYNLQICWSTGHLAGESAAKFYYTGIS